MPPQCTLFTLKYANVLSRNLSVSEKNRRIATHCRTVFARHMLSEIFDTEFGSFINFTTNEWEREGNTFRRARTQSAIPTQF